MILHKRIFILFSLFVILFPLASEAYKKNVIVSFYADDFHGKQTSSGENFNMYDLTCANKTLPFDTQLKVTNLKNGKSVIVRVNDRGPFVPDRELDLSKAAAIKLDMVKDGTARVDIEIIKRGPDSNLSKETAAAANKIMIRRFGENWNKNEKTETSPSKGKNSIESAPAGSVFEIQLASFTKKENAQNFAKKLSSQGFKNIFIRNSPDNYKVLIKDVPKSEVVKLDKRLKDKGYKDFIIRKID